MRAEEIITGVRARRAALQEEIFGKPPSDYVEFQKRLGIWLGLGQILTIVEDIRKKEQENED